MKSHNKHKISQEYLVRYALGELDASEEKHIQTWMKENSDNEKILQELSTIINDVEQFKISNKIDIDKEWLIFLSNKENNNNKSLVIKKKLFFLNKVAILIGIILLSAIGYFIFQYHSNHQYIWVDAGDKVCNITLQDGSSIVLNKGARLGYSKAFLKKNRNVKLIGEAFFNIAHRNFPTFIVESDKILIKDIGTAFNVRKIQDEIQIIVEEGKVSVESNNTSLLLSADEIVNINQSDNVMKKTIIKDKFYQYYRTKKFDCNATPLLELVNGLNDLYKQNIILENKLLDNIPITVYFEDQPLDKILNIICDTLKLQWSKNTDGKIVIDKIK